MPQLQITKAQKNTISAIIASKTKISLDTEALQDDLKALAIDLNLKPAAATRLVNLVMKEQAKGSVIEEEQRLLDLAEQVFDEVPEPQA